MPNSSDAWLQRGKPVELLGLLHARRTKNLSKYAAHRLYPRNAVLKAHGRLSMEHLLPDAAR